jgi:Ferritin-like
LDYLNKHDPKLFHPETAAYQFAPGLGYQPRVRDAGGSVVVTDIVTANRAIDIIVDQGEGNPGPYDDPAKEEKDHYDVFRDLQRGTQTWDVYPVRTNPTTLGYWDDDKRIYQVRVVHLLQRHPESNY